MGTEVNFDELETEVTEWRSRHSAPAADERIHSAPEYSDEALALEFTKRHKENLRYVAPWSRWLEWDGAKWRMDKTLRAYDLARAVCRDMANGCDKESVARAIGSAATVSAVERLARSDRMHAATVDQWDADLWLLNTPAGTVDLNTGTLASHRREDHCTKITATAPQPRDCPVWRQFLARVTDGDEALQSYLQRLAGYSLTGATTEQMFAFAYGTGANGKSTFLDALTGIMGDYASIAASSTFMAARNEGHPTDLAHLRGARLVTAIETEEGKRWAEAKIKSLTGGDKITARYMRQDFFEFTPQFKLIVAGNHRPGIRAIDEAMRRRLHLIPFTVTIPAAERDHDLPVKLRDEWPAIFNWMIEGCLEWQASGLAAPDRVKAATQEYLDAEDSFSEWLGECTLNDRAGYETTADLFTSWKGWAERAGEFVGTQKSFGQTMQERGYMQKRQGGTGKKGYAGVTLIREDMSHAYWNK